MENQSTCSDLARAQGAMLPGTAPQARAYLLVEHPGPWPAKAFEGNTVDPVAGKRIAERAAADGVRPLFIRRPGSTYRPDQHEFSWAYVDASAADITWHEPTPLGDIADAAWPDPARAIGPLDSDPLYLICTHGRRDQCCATRGRPVAAAFAQLRPNQTWECSHIGGHRLAGIVVALPHGDIYGLVDPADAGAIITAAESGQVHVPLLRGCSVDEPAVQAAKIAVLQQTGSANPRHLQTISYRQVQQSPSEAATRWLVHLRAFGSNGAHWQLEVRREPAGAAPASCGKQPTETFTWVVSGGHREAANPRV